MTPEEILAADRGGAFSDEARNISLRLRRLQHQLRHSPHSEDRDDSDALGRAVARLADIERFVREMCRTPPADCTCEGCAAKRARLEGQARDGF